VANLLQMQHCIVVSNGPEPESTTALLLVVLPCVAGAGCEKPLRFPKVSRSTVDAREKQKGVRNEIH